MEATTPSVRIRINHSRTIKEGWGYETTVEIVGPTPPAAGEVEALLAQARTLGETERDERNRRDADRTS